MPVDLSGDMTVTATITGETEAFTVAAAGGAVGAGASVAVAYIGSENKALTDMSGVTMRAGSLTIQAGTADKPAASQAVVMGITGSAGAAAINLNIGLALNAAVNRAALTGEGGTLTLSGSKGLKVTANGKGRAYSALYSMAVGNAAVNVSLAFSWAKNVQEAVVDSTGDITVETARRSPSPPARMA